MPIPDFTPAVDTGYAPSYTLSIAHPWPSVPLLFFDNSHSHIFSTRSERN